MDERTLRERTKQTARMLFHTLTSGTGFELWKKFDRGLARELSMFFTGVLYSREVLSQKQRELCAVAALTALHRPNEVRAHIHAALNVGDAPGGGGGDLPAGHLRRDARRRGRARGLRQRARRARRAFSRRRGVAVSQRALDAAVDAARAAGRIALKYFRGGFEVAKKADDTPVTPADREAEQAIVEILGRAFPDCGVLGEEFGGRGTKEVRWIVDPIDGTKNFVRGIGIWATLIALEERGEVTVGVIHNPVTAELYTARRGAGAFLNGERIRVSDVAEPGRAFFLHAGLGIVRKGGHWDGFARLIDATDRQRGFASMSR